jgi:hypothetical protein
VFPGSHNSDIWPDLQDIVEISMINRNWSPEGWICGSSGGFVGSGGSDGRQWRERN